MTEGALIPEEHVPRWLLDEQGVILSADNTFHLSTDLAPGKSFPLPDTVSGNASVFFLKGQLYCYLPLENSRACVLATTTSPLLNHLAEAEARSDLLPLPVQQTYTAVKELASRIPEHKAGFEKIIRHFRSLYRTNMLYREHVRLLLCANKPFPKPVSLHILFSQMQKLLQTSLPSLEARIAFSLDDLPAIIKADELSLTQGFYFLVSHLAEKECFTIRLSEGRRTVSVHMEGLCRSNVLTSPEGAFLKDVVESADGLFREEKGSLILTFPSCGDLYLRSSTDPAPSTLFRMAFGPYLEL